MVLEYWFLIYECIEKRLIFYYIVSNILIPTNTLFRPDDGQRHLFQRDLVAVRISDCVKDTDESAMFCLS